VTTTHDIGNAKERIVDSLTTARDASAAALDEIVPAIATAFEAARDASGPLYAEATNRAGNAASALTGKTRTHRRRWPIVAAGLAVGAAILTIMKRRDGHVGLIDVTEAPRISRETPSAEAEVSDAAPRD
jgi:hypothetical protein